VNLRIESAAIDSLMVRLFDQIDEANMPWLIAAAENLRAAFGAQLIDLVPSYTTLLLHYDLHALGEADAIALIHSSLHNLQPLTNETGTLHAIPVWYHQSVGPELTSIAQRAGLSPEQVIEQHCSRDYPVFTLGFAPGFAYMGLVDEALASARLATPRQRVPKGSVGIAERQTAIYPLTSPGGWNLIGRCPLTLFSADHGSLLQPGDRVRFVSIDHAEFIRLGGDDTAMEASA
jgi:KipI family sensor histidine kinase inhibitor|tara:strand:- start:2493 stop:3191 length:699 start_codon:yes stop_codon:yes gene_type:complete